MVFEATVTEVLNKVLGSYVENLNSSQLKIGIWGGDVVLEDLRLRSNVLKELDVPIEVVYGYLGKLVLKIPWKNLYKESVVANVEKLLLIVNPIADIKYDAAREEQMALANKRAELMRVEEAKKLEAQKNAPKVDDTFVEKLVAQIIKNVQLRITDIHVRYEDTTTNPDSPFSFGITLHDLSVHTTDQNWQAAIVQDAVSKIHKILSLDSLAVYWNASSKMYSKLTREDKYKALKEEIVTKSSKIDYYDYVLGPINATCRLKLNMKPEADEPPFSIPKCVLMLHMEQLSMNMTKSQYHGIMKLVDSMDRMSKSAPFRKFRPDVKSYRGYYKLWWRYAYTCALEDVRRRKRNWDWNHIIAHRNLGREYALAYRTSLINKGKVTSREQEIIDKGEKNLDMVSLVIIRQRIELEVTRIVKENESKRGWLSSWWAGSKGNANSDENLLLQLERDMTPEEKSKLYRAIDYHENTAPLHLPTEYIAFEADFQLDQLQLVLKDSKQVLRAAVDNVALGVNQRPSASALRIEGKIKKFTVLGVEQKGAEPQLVSSQNLTGDDNLVRFVYETNPISGDCDQRLRVSARPLQIIYDGRTIIDLVEVFKIPSAEANAISQLQYVATNKMQDWKEKSTMGLQYAVQQHTFIDIDIDIASSYLIVPESGFYTGQEACAVVNLGAISVKSEPRSQQALNVHAMFKEGLASEEILKELIQYVYDKFVLNINDMQIVIALKNEQWKNVLTSREPSKLHLLQPTTLAIQIQKCLVMDDPRLPKIKVRGELQKIAVTASEERLWHLLQLVVGIPLPQSEVATEIQDAEGKGSSRSLLRYLDPAEKERRDNKRAVKHSDPTTQLIEVEAFFMMKELVLVMEKMEQDACVKLLQFKLEHLELKATQRTFTLDTVLKLGSVGLDHFRPDADVVHVVETPRVLWHEGENSRYLFAVNYTNVDKRCPDFRSVYGSVEQLIVLDFKTLKLLLHLEGLKQLLMLGNEYQRRIVAVSKERDRIADAGPLPTITEGQELTVKTNKQSQAKSGSKAVVESIQLKVRVHMAAIDIRLETDQRPILDACVHGLHMGLIVKPSYTQVDVSLEEIKILDLNPVTIHKEILKVLGGNVANVQLVMFNLEQFPNISESNISIDAQINCVRIVFLNWFVTTTLEFLNNFQAAQEAIAEASAQAAEAARANMQSAYVNSTKVALKVKLDAPIIITPENSTSQQALLVDLGCLMIQNRFVVLPTHDKGHANEVTVDEISLDLNDVKVSSVELTLKDDGFIEDHMLLKPTSFTLLVKRSLSSWYDKLPDLEMSGRLRGISILVYNTDYQMIMKVLGENLNEGQKHNPPPAKSEPKGTSKLSSITKDKIVEVAQVATQVTHNEKKALRTTMKFIFTMDSLKIDLINYQTSSVLAAPAKKTNLAQFCLLVLSMKARFLSDGSLHASVLLVDCILDDLRPRPDAVITRYLERRTEDEGENDENDKGDKLRSMIDVTYNTSGTDTFVDIRIYSFNMILAMDFMLKVLEFVTPPPKNVVEEEIPVTEDELVPSHDVHIHETKSEALQKKRSSSVVLTPDKKPSMMTVNIKVERPEIILVETLAAKDCEALVLNTEMKFKLRLAEERMALSGCVAEFQMYIRSVGATVAEGARDYVLEPFDVSLTGAQPPDSGLHLDVAITPVKININPDSLALVNRVVATATAADESADNLVNVPRTYQNLWGVYRFDPRSYWFLKPAELGQDALRVTEADLAEPPKKVVGEICLMSCPSITISMDMSVGHESLHVLVMESSFNAQVKDWSSELYCESTLAMQVSYYNLAKAVWEPLIEPIEVLKDTKYTYVPWELKIEIIMRDNEDFKELLSNMDLNDEAEVAMVLSQRPANKSIHVSSRDTLELTVSYTCLELLTQLSNSIAAANVSSEMAVQELDKQVASIQHLDKALRGAPYVIHNLTGLTVTLVLPEDGNFSVFTGHKHADPVTEYSEVVLEPGTKLPLQLRSGPPSMLTLGQEAPVHILEIKVADSPESLLLPVAKADKRYFALEKRKGSAAHSSDLMNSAGLISSGLISSSLISSGLIRTQSSRVKSLCEPELKGLVSEIKMHDCAMQIYLSGTVQITNNLSEPATVYYMTESGDEVSSLGVVKPREVMRLPVNAVHTLTGELFFSFDGFTVTESPFIWRELISEIKRTKMMQCDPLDRLSGEGFFFKAIGTRRQIFLEGTSRKTLRSTCYDITLQSAVAFHNSLPVNIELLAYGSTRRRKFQPGEMLDLFYLVPGKASLVVVIPDYLGKCWSTEYCLPELEMSVWTFTSHDSPAPMTLDLGVYNKDQNGTQVLSLYCPFWMLNKTGLTLSYRGDEDMVLFHPPEQTDPMLFSFKPKNFFGKKKASIRVGFGDWSNKFPLDVPGSSGVVLCKTENKEYQVAVSNQLTFNSLTKMVIFSPFFVLNNEAPFDLECQELFRAGDPWEKIEAGKSRALWPTSQKEDKLLIVRVAGTKEYTKPFLYTEQNATTLKLENEYGGIRVETQLNEGGTYITFRQYAEGLAPALIVNYTEHTVRFHESDNVNIREIPGMHQMLYTWENPAGIRMIVFQGQENDIEDSLRKDEIQKIMLNDKIVYWVSFLDGLQRVQLFTEDPVLAQAVHTAGEAELMDTELELSVQGVGMSLVNDKDDSQEILYVSMSSSGIIWEQCKFGSRRYKKVNPHNKVKLEAAYQRFLAECEVVGPVKANGVVVLDNKIEVDFKQMRQLKPARLLRRTLEPALWLLNGQSARLRRLHVRLHHLQVDQQLPASRFPVVLAPVPPPRSVVAPTGPRPFAELSVVERIMLHSKVRQYKYLRLLVQEFYVKVDLGFVKALLEMFPQNIPDKSEAFELFQKDMEIARRPLEEFAAVIAVTDQRNFYDCLHLTPLKIRLSFSLQGSETLPSFLGTVLQGIGVTLTDMNDVLFKLSFYERNYEFMSQKELASQVQAHYTGQALKQMYVLVLGLDVLGNPYGLIIGVKKGVEDLFYEPIQGAIQGPSEFAEGLVIGVRSLFGNTVGGAAGAVSKITGAMGSGLAALSFDKDYQARRRAQLSKRPANFQEGIAASGKGLVMGVYDGVTGVFTKPISGARDEGVGGFFKGLGQGAVGLVARPTAGVVDFASGSLGAIKRCTDMTEELARKRPPRYFLPDRGLQPYSRTKADGYKLLSEIDKGKYLSTDSYACHVWVEPDKEAILCTDQRILSVSKNTVFGGWQCDWGYLWSELTEPPKLTDEGVFIPTARKKVLGMFTGSSHGKQIVLGDTKQSVFLHSQCMKYYEEHSG